MSTVNWVVYLLYPNLVFFVKHEFISVLALSAWNVRKVEAMRLDFMVFGS